MPHVMAPTATILSQNPTAGSNRFKMHQDPLSISAPPNSTIFSPNSHPYNVNWMYSYRGYEQNSPNEQIPLQVFFI